MVKFKVNIKVNKPIAIVYQAFIDSDNMLKWTKNLEKIEIINGEFLEVGAIAHLHYNQKGRTYILEDKLEFLDPEKKIISQVSGGGLIIYVETIFSSYGDISEITIEWNGKGQNLLLKLLLPFLKTKIRNSAQSELDKFKELVEEYGIMFQ